MSSKNPVVALGKVMLLSARADSGALDEAGTRLLSQAVEELHRLPPRVLVEAFMDWNRQGRPVFDPRPSVVKTLPDDRL